MQAQQLGVCVGRHPFSLLLLFNNTTTRSNPSFLQHRPAPTCLQLHVTHRLQVSATLQGNVTESIAGNYYRNTSCQSLETYSIVHKDMPSYVVLAAVTRCKIGQGEVRATEEVRVWSQFCVVGDDELVGAWNPEAALPMQWSEGHIWTTELEVSTGKRIEFKVILVGNEGVMEWQPGPNRVLETMESLSPLEVLESWSGEDLDDAFSGLEMSELSDIQNLSPNSVMDVGGVELPIHVVDSEAICENIDGLSEQSSLVAEKQTVNLSPDDSNTDMARELSVFEKDLQWVRKTFSMLRNAFSKERQRGV